MTESAEAPAWPGKLVIDPSAQVLDGGHVLIGGSPLKVLRFREPIDLASLQSDEITNKLIETGIVQPQPHDGPFEAHDVTVVIPVSNDVNALAQTLAALTRSEKQPGAIIVVDDGSDHPDAIAATVALAGNPIIRLIRQQTNGGPATARNVGFAEVTTPIVAFVDAGCVPEPAWLTVLLPHFGDPNVAAVAPRIVADPTRVAGNDDAPLSWVRRQIARYETRRSPLDLGPLPALVAPMTRVSYVPSACLIARTDAVVGVDGFDEDLRVGEDVDLVWLLCDHHRVRYEPRAKATHDVRVRPTRFLRRRFDYGTSAAPLAKRHSSALAPVTLSPWSAAVWGAQATGHVAIGTGLAALSTGLLVRKLGGLEQPVPVALRLAGLGNLAAGRLLADALRRTWWPLALIGALFGPRSLRRMIAGAFILAPLSQWRMSSGLDPVTWLVLHVADDVAYGAGVWAGCATEHTIAPLIPDFGAGRFPSFRNLTRYGSAGAITRQISESSESRENRD